MPEYLAPGVYVEEVETGPVPIAGVSTSTAGFVGMTARGTIDGLPVLVTSFAEYTRTFGGYLPEIWSDGNPLPKERSMLPYAVKGFFDNGGQRLYIKRVIAGDKQPEKATSSADTLKGGVIVRLKDGSVPKVATTGAGDNKTSTTTIQLSSLRGIQKSTVLTFYQTKDGVTQSEKAPAIESYDDTKNQVILSGTLANTYDPKYTYVVAATDPAVTTTPLTITTLQGGAYGNGLIIKVAPVTKVQRVVTGSTIATLIESTKGSGTFDTLQLGSATGFYTGAILEINKGQTKLYNKVKAINGNNLLLESALTADDLKPDTGSSSTIISTCEFSLTVSYGNTTESYAPLTLDKNTPYYVLNQINGISQLISVTLSAADTSTNPFSFPVAADGLNVILVGGSDGGIPSFDDYKGNGDVPGQKTGIQALEDIDEISIVAVPGITDQDVINTLIIHCQQIKYRFAIIDPIYGVGSPLEDIKTWRDNYDTEYAALYFPNVLVSNPVRAGTIAVPPAGHMAGIYAYVDDARGVYKAPANEVIQGILGLDLTINKREQDILNPININVLRDFRTDGRGLRVWGARCLTSDTLWQYINVRRLFIFIEKSLDKGTQWVVFEPNDYRLWNRVIQSITDFLTTVWRDGALLGQKAEEAFFVRCGLGITMTQDDLDNGRLIVEVGIAPVKPAEFVILRISQTATAAAS